MSVGTSVGDVPGALEDPHTVNSRGDTSEVKPTVLLHG
jgi:hypothetical protein